MRERPILYSKAMILALLAGLKTQTRRIIKNGKPGDDLLCPYGAIGDRLWVREGWQPQGFLCNGDETDYEFLIKYLADDSQMHDYFDDIDREIKFSDMIDKELTAKMIKVNGNGSWDGPCPLRNRPGIHMWKEFSRIWLEIIGVRAERLLDISEADALAEGVERWPSGMRFYPTMFQSYLDPQEPIGYKPRAYLAASQSYIELWEVINGKESANANPWVWVIEFKLLSTTGKNNIKADQEAVAV